CEGFTARTRQQERPPPRWSATIPDSSAVASTSREKRRTPASFSCSPDRKVAILDARNFCTVPFAKCGNRDAVLSKARYSRPIQSSCQSRRVRRCARTCAKDADTSSRTRYRGRCPPCCLRHPCARQKSPVRFRSFAPECRLERHSPFPCARAPFSKWGGNAPG